MSAIREDEVKQLDDAASNSSAIGSMIRRVFSVGRSCVIIERASERGLPFLMFVALELELAPS